ncbi:MAG: Sigma-54 dependent response regulator [Labilithrix sp.]|nr:Sigma-54 dependent response regulator [Labilithrix sp.]
MVDVVSANESEHTQTANGVPMGQERAARTDAGLVLLYADSFAALPTVFPVDDDVAVIGRTKPAHVVIAHPTISRMHAHIARTDDGFVLRDVGGRSGVLVDGRRVTETFLAHGSQIRIGDVLLSFVAHGASAYAPYRIDGAVADGARRVSIPGAVGGMQLARVSAEVSNIGPTELPVLVLGETGTGKELVAAALHAASGRSGPLRALNCAAIPAALVESELFGFKKGAFSGANRDHPGIIRAAHGGTLLLDEIGDMPLEAQAKLLRTLETREVVPVGGVTAEKVDVRVVSATHRDVRSRVEEGLFRGDLYARLNGYTLSLRPLRERKEDLHLLVRHFLAEAGEASRPMTFRFMVTICQHDWPFNVRELASAIRRALSVSEGGPLDASDLPDTVTASMKDYGAPASTSAPQPSLPPPSTDPAKPRFQRPAPADLEALLREHRGNVAAVARVLGKDRAQIHRWMQMFGIDPDSHR